MSAIILFDGVCNLCNRAVQFVIARDADAYFKFASLQSEAAKKMLTEHTLPSSATNSIILIDHGTMYSQSDAVLRIARRLRGPSSLLYGFIIVPAFIRNGVYKIIAGNRYRWFGQREECMIPTADIKERFIE